MLPVFPLPSTVVFPGMRVPLYVFENRYKRLVRYCLDQDEPRFVIALARQENGILDGASPFARVGTVVRVVQLAEHPDGTYNLLGYGQDRCHTVLHHAEEIAEADGSSRALHFSEAALYPLERGDPNLERVVAWDAQDTFREYAKTFFAFDALRQIEEAMPDDLVFQASFICANIRVPVDSRQVLLEAPSLLQRFRIAQKLMQERLAAHRPARE